MPYGSPGAGPSNVSLGNYTLGSDSIPQTKFPGPLQTHFSDPYWKKAAGPLCERAAREADQAFELLGSRHCPTEARTQLKEGITRVNADAEAYHQAVARKQKPAARLQVKELAESVTDLWLVRHRSSAQAKEQEIEEIRDMELQLREEAFIQKRFQELNNLEEARRASLLEEKEAQKKIEDDYALIAQRSKGATILTSPARAVLTERRWPRVEVLKRAAAWFRGGFEIKRIHWIRGERQCGKSTILHRIASLCCESAKPTGPSPAWVAGVAFDKAYTNEDFVSTFLATVLHQIGSRFFDVKRAIAKASAWIDDHDAWFREQFLPIQIEDLFVTPLTQVVRRENPAPIVISLDGLDQCDAAALEKVFQFVEITLRSSLPIYFIITANSGGRADKAHLSQSPLAASVDVNDVPCLAEEIARYQPSKAGGDNSSANDPAKKMAQHQPHKVQSDNHSLNDPMEELIRKMAKWRASDDSSDVCDSASVSDSGISL